MSSKFLNIILTLWLLLLQFYIYQYLYYFTIIRPRRSRSAAAIVIKLSRVHSVGRSVCPVHCGKTADRSRQPFGTVGRTGPRMRQVLGFGNLSTGRGTFGGEFGAHHCPQGPIGPTCATVLWRGPLAKFTLGRLVIIIAQPVFGRSVIQLYLAVLSMCWGECLPVAAAVWLVIERVTVAAVCWVQVSLLVICPTIRRSR